MTEKPLIYDFGMHIADDTEVYLLKGFRVVAVEADPTLCSLAEARFAAEIDRGDLVVLNKAIGRTPGVFTFYVCNEQNRLSTASLAVVEMQRRHTGVTFRAHPVEFVGADQILRDHGPARYAKIDIEGHDVICLEQMAEATTCVDFVSFELDLADHDAAIAACRKMGFTRFALVDQRTIGGLRAPVPSAEGASIAYTYELGQSGPFGADLQAEWLDAGAIRARCRGLRRQSRISGLGTRVGALIGARQAAARLQARYLSAAQTWYDIHAARG